MPRVRAGLREPSRKRLRASGTRERIPRALDGREANRLLGFSVILLFVEVLLCATSQTEPLLLGRCPRGPRHHPLSPEPPHPPPVFCLLLFSRVSGPADQTSLLTAFFYSKLASLLPSVDTPLSQAIADPVVSFPTPSPTAGLLTEHACPRAFAVTFVSSFPQQGQLLAWLSPSSSRSFLFWDVLRAASLPLSPPPSLHIRLLCYVDEGLVPGCNPACRERMTQECSVNTWGMNGSCWGTQRIQSHPR